MAQTDGLERLHLLARVNFSLHLVAKIMHKLLPKFCLQLSNYQVDNPAHAFIFKSTLFNAAILPAIPSLDIITSQSAYTDHDDSSIRPYAPLDLPHPGKEISHCLSKAANEMAT